MNRPRRLTPAAAAYLRRFDDILNEMIRGMTQAELTNSISHNFIVQMIPHHRAAIEMSKNILTYTENRTLRGIATNIIAEQTKSIANMQSIERGCSRRSNSPQDLRLYQSQMDQIMRTMFTQMRRAPATNRLNCTFMWEMIPHHRGAVEMSTNTLQFAICPELVPILQAIITSQETGIAQMQALLRQLRC